MENKKNDILVVVDMQKDFVDGSLGTKEAVEIVDNVAELIRSDRFDSMIVTYDTHEKNYLDTQEGHNLPVVHCVRKSEGWMLDKKIQAALDENSTRPCAIVTKVTFGGEKVIEALEGIRKYVGEPTSFTFVGLCTDICVISNALLIKAYYPEVPMYVVENATAGVTPDLKDAAMKVMASCQIKSC